MNKEFNNNNTHAIAETRFVRQTVRLEVESLEENKGRSICPCTHQLHGDTMTSNGQSMLDATGFTN
ncbi:hypothetical protein LZQ00_00685 [Sphingobacterium sp. SRCM116780]|uniref:hypothetical protein n=1 Tax=Sphingobacterium sp. SRCM116780 TaxID=2907623 RepID=UPI001F2AC347|nr:hypothetical protein [Sphingobacterium sp. SRCM116780]UIR56358.1 hypothetical protein LZQ00_00685 [Sphingobacterium sp. SRCM116780]